MNEDDETTGDQIGEVVLLFLCVVFYVTALVGVISLGSWIAEFFN